METITTLISFALLSGLVFGPILLTMRLNRLNIQYRFFAYLALGIAATAILTLAFAWWSATSDRVLLVHYGYHTDGMSEAGYYGQVSPENMERVKSLEKSITAIGWPLKALMTYAVYFPYFLMVYFVSYAMRSHRKKHST